MTHSLPLDRTAGSAADPGSPRLPQEWAGQLEAVMQQDRQYFLQHPEQDYYIRPITPVEVIEGQSLGKPVTEAAMVLVGEVAPGSRVRLTMLAGGEPPLAEFRAIQQQMRNQLGVPPRDWTDRLKRRSKARPKAKGFG